VEQKHSTVEDHGKGAWYDEKVNMGTAGKKGEATNDPMRFKRILLGLGMGINPLDFSE